MGFFDSIADVAKDIGGGFIDAIDDVVDSTIDVAESVVETISSISNTTFDITGDVVESVFDIVGLDDWGNEIDNAFDAVGDGVEYVLDDIIGDISLTAVERASNAILNIPNRFDEFSDSFWDDFWNDDDGILAGFTDWFVDNIENAAELVGLPEIIETTADVLKLISTRPLTDREIDIARSVFGNSIDYSLVRIDEWALTATEEFQTTFNDETSGDRPYVMFNTINTWGALDSDETFIHELTHIWQYQVEYGADYAPLALKAQQSEEGYDYGGVGELERRMNAGQGITDFNLEQQGDIVAHYYTIREDGDPSNDNDLPIYAYFVDQVSTLSQEELALGNTQRPGSSLGTITPGVESSLTGTVGSSNPDDVYNFTLDSASSVQVTLQGLTADADVEILDSTGSVIDSSNNSGTASENLQVELEAGDYSVRIESYENAETGYDLVLIPTPTTGGNSIISFMTPNADIADSGSPVAGVTPGENIIDGQVEWLFGNGDDTGTVPVGYTRVKGLSGHDNITGGSVAEWYNGNQGNDTLNGAGGTDTIFGGKGSDNLNGDAEGDQMFGNLNNDVLTGGDGNDTIFGGREDDIISGGAGDDVLFGDKGQDQLTGGPGNDIFALPGSAAAATTLSQADVIMDYEIGNDSLMLPGEVSESQLTFSSVNLQVDGGSAEASTVIELDGAFLAIVKGITSESDLNFVGFDLSVVPTN